MHYSYKLVELHTLSWITACNVAQAAQSQPIAASKYIYVERLIDLHNSSALHAGRALQITSSYLVNFYNFPFSFNCSAFRNKMIRFY